MNLSSGAAGLILVQVLLVTGNLFIINYLVILYFKFVYLLRRVSMVD